MTAFVSREYGLNIRNNALHGITPSSTISRSDVLVVLHSLLLLSRLEPGEDAPDGLLGPGEPGTDDGVDSPLPIT